MPVQALAQMVTIKRPEEIARMRHAGAILADVLVALEAALRPGVTTAELDAIAARIIRDAGAIPSFLGYGGSHGAIPFPGTICASINDEVVHGIPSAERRLRSGECTGSLKAEPEQPGPGRHGRGPGAVQRPVEDRIDLRRPVRRDRQGRLPPGIRGSPEEEVRAVGPGGSHRPARVTPP